MIAESDFLAVLPRKGLFYAPLVEALRRYNIDTPMRYAIFLAQVCHESGGFRWLEEIWGPTRAQRRYEGRRDLGNTQPGDGYRFRGRGLIQLTGRANYQQYSDARGIDFVSMPDLVATPEHAVDVAAWYWDSRDLNPYADKGWFKTITRRINGGLNGYQDRLRWMEKWWRVLGDD